MLKIQPPGDGYFAELIAMPRQKLREYFRDPTWLGSAQCHLDFMYANAFLYGLHKLYKDKWDSSHKNPIRQTSRKMGKPFCDLLRAFLEVGEYCWLYVGNHPCDHVLLWFQQGAFEIWQLYINLPDQTKSGKADELRHIVRALENSENPFHATEQPALFWLGEAIANLQTQPQHKNACRKLLRARGGEKSLPGLFTVLKTLAQDYDKNPDRVPTWTEGKQFCQRIGSGGRVSKTTVPQKVYKT
jgi:hypothetical protein